MDRPVPPCTCCCIVNELPRPESYAEFELPMASEHSSSTCDTRFSVMEVFSPLGLDTNLMVLGERVTVSVSGPLLQSEGDDEMIDICPVTASSVPTSAEVKVVNVGGDDEITTRGHSWGNTKPFDAEKSRYQTRSHFLVSFLPREAVQYTLEVKYRKEHVSGSPFTVVAVSTLEESRERTEIAAGEPVTFALPMSWHQRSVSPTILVGGPRGACDVVNRSRNKSVSFFPNQPGDYTISLLSGENQRGETYCITARSGDMGASKCYVVETDKSVFQKPVRFAVGKSMTFQVNTEQAYGMGQLRVVARGPHEANVIVSNVEIGVDKVMFQPSAPGKYTLDVLWGGYPIQDSPFTLHFKKPRCQVETNGLNLSKETLVINIPFHFKLSCREAEEGDIQVYCVPPSAASTRVTPAGSPDVFLCEITPRECGTHRLSVELQGIHVSGSPFLVRFRPRGNPARCQLEGVIEKVQSSPTLKFYVDTDRAGEGKLTAVAIEEVTKEKLVATVNKLDRGRHMVEFTPGRGLECKLGVLYDGQHITGSPFPLIFPGAASFTVEGDGLIRATINKISHFTVHSVNGGPGVFSVSIEGPQNTNVVPTIISKVPRVFDVRYVPSVVGEYLIFVRWGQHQIPGSPFTVECFSQDSLSHFVIWRPSSRIPHSCPIEFTVEDGRTEREKLRDKSPLSVEARAQTTGKVLTALTSRDNDGNINCQFQPPDPDNYTVIVKCRGMELQGSPFRVTVPFPPKAERVRVWGEGLLDHRLPRSGRASQFMVDTTDAGSGILGIKVSVCISCHTHTLTQKLLTVLDIIKGILQVRGSNFHKGSISLLH